MLKLLALTGLAVGASAASAQTTTTDWTGPYVGIHGGYGISTGDKITNEGVTPNNLLALDAGIRARTVYADRNGLLGGGQLGYNRQSGSLVYGVEADFTFMDSNGSTTYRSPQQVLTFPAGRRMFVKNDLDWMGTVRARAGYAVGSGMVYATGGYAYGKVKGYAEFNGDTDAVVNYAGRNKYVAQGWTAGGGAEIRPFSEGALSRVSVKMEGNYYDLGHSHTYALQANTPAGYYVLRRATRGVNAKVGLNYAF